MLRSDRLAVTATVLVGLSLTTSGCVDAPGPGDDVSHSDRLSKSLDTDADYARAVQAFNPWLEHWTVNGDSVAYEIRSCGSPKPTTYTGTFGPEDVENGDRREVTWADGKAPRLDSYLIVTDDYLAEEVTVDIDGGRAVTDIEGQNSRWLRLCKESI